jgi:hypothetical protein
MGGDVGELLQLGIGRFELRGGLTQLLLRTLAVGDVTDDARDQQPVWLCERAKANQVNLKAGTVAGSQRPR